MYEREVLSDFHGVLAEKNNKTSWTYSNQNNIMLFCCKCLSHNKLKITSLESELDTAEFHIRIRPNPFFPDQA